MSWSTFFARDFVVREVAFFCAFLRDFLSRKNAWLIEKVHFCKKWDSRNPVFHFLGVQKGRALLRARTSASTCALFKRALAREKRWGAFSRARFYLNAP